jgi:hypothetical protein
MDALHCSLRVPLDYPTGGKPTLTVTNPDMERGYQINIERGFDRIAAADKSSTLLGCLNTLDRQLESMLSSRKADTVKIVSHSRKAEKAESMHTPHAKDRAPSSAVPSPTPPVARAEAKKPIAYAAYQKSQAKAIRDAEVNQLEARMGKLPSFSRSKDGLVYTVPIEVRKRAELPTELQAVKQVKLIVPETYNLTPCRIQLVGVNGTASQAVEDAFERRAKLVPHMSLFNRINYLSQNMHTMAKHSTIPTDTNPSTEPSAQPKLDVIAAEPEFTPSEPRSSLEASDRRHVVVIPRPPEWDAGKTDDDGDSDSSSESEDGPHTDDGSSARVEEEAPASTDALIPERGVSVSFPHLELYGIELLEVSALSITVKCDRCKDTKDIPNLQNNADGVHSRKDSCKKCALPFVVGRLTSVSNQQLSNGY